jgi:mercuric reductase
MTEKEIRVRLSVHGMTCTGCEEHVTKALEKVGAKDVTASFRRGEAIFSLPGHVDMEEAKKAIREAKYQSGDAEVIQPQEKAVLGDEGDYDLLIIGSGGAAFSAAIKAVEQKAKVAIIERGTIGGTCVNIGCVPSKTLLRAGEINHLAKFNPFLGLNTSAGQVDLGQLMEKKNELVQKLRNEKYVNLIGEYGFELIQGEAVFVDEKTIEVNGRKITAKSFLIATGASPAIPDIPGLEEVNYLTSTSLLELKELPKRLAVIGSGYIAMELGQLFHHLGVEVILMQRGPRILKLYDPEISDAVTQALREQGINLITNARFEQVEKDGDTKRIHIVVDGENQIIEADQVLIATGRKPNTASLQLDRAGVKVGSRDEVIVDEYLRTSNPRIYAAGDVTMGPQFVYVAAYEAW